MPDPLIDALMTREAYYNWYERQPRGRYERVDGAVYAMAPERGAHAKMKAALWLALRVAIRDAGIDCEALPDGIAVATGDSDYEPDALVNCSPLIGDDAVSAPNPVVVVEVLSPITGSVDTGAKLAGYFAVPSVRHYLIVHPTRRKVIHHRRGQSGGIETAILAGGMLRLDPPGILLDVGAVYAAAGVVG